MPRCSVKGCTETLFNGGLCVVHFKHAEWQDNTNINKLGIVRFSQDLFPARIDKRYGVPRMHKEIYADLLRALVTGKSKLDRLHVIAAPREHSKSTIISFVYVMYCILFRLKKYIVLISESEEKTKQFVRSIKKALALEEVRQYFGNISTRVLSTEGGKWSESHIVTSTSITIRALGVGQSARGLIEETRPDLVIADDAESEQNTKTEDARTNNWKWWNAQVVPAADMINGQCVYIGTMVHSGCILAKLIENDNNYRKRFYQVYTNPEQTETLWPEKFPIELVKKIEREFRSDPDLGVGLFFMEYMNIAVDPENRIFPDDSIVRGEFRYFQDKLGKWIEYEGEIVNVETFLGVDPASSLKRTAAYTCIMAGAVDCKGRLFILEYVLDRLPIRTTTNGKRGSVDETVRLARKYQVERIGFEVTGVGRPICQTLMREIQVEENAIPGWYPRVIELEAPQEMNKVDKIRIRLEDPHKSRMVIQRPTMRELVAAQEQFPKSRIIDILDAESNLVTVMHPPFIKLHYDPNGEARMTLKKPKRVLDWETI